MKSVVNKHLALAILAAALGACDTLPPDASSAYRAGYRFGCEIGYAEAGRERWQQSLHTKDNERLASDAEYRRGWEHGYGECFKEGSRYLEILPGGDGGTEVN